MKYQSLSSFQKHLVSAAPNHLCRIYLIGIANDFERAKTMDSIVKYLPGSLSRFTAKVDDLKEVLDSMQSMSLLGESIVVFDEVEKLLKKEMELLTKALSEPSGYVVLGLRTRQAKLMEVAEKEGVVLDLIGEKPWDREKRIGLQVTELVRGANKSFGVGALELLFERVGFDAALLESEVEKLICYTGERAVIGREDIFAISSVSKAASFWQIAEAVIWEGGEFGTLDNNAFHAIVPALRNQLHIGLTLATLIEERRPSTEWSQFLPKLFPKTLEKRSSQAARLGSAYFKKGIEHLFDMELDSRNTSGNLNTLLDLFRAKIYAR